jgi:hypothetical protein
MLEDSVPGAVIELNMEADLVIDNSEINPTEAIVLDLEREIGCSLPIFYRNWIINNGGTRPVNDCVFCKLADDPILNISEFYDINEVLRLYNFYKDVFPKSWISIGMSLGNDQTILDLENGNIRYLPIDKFYGVKQIDKNAGYFIARDFESLLKIMMPGEFLIANLTALMRDGPT